MTPPPSLPHWQLIVPPLLYTPSETIDPPFIPPENYVILQNPPHPTPPTLLPSSQTKARPSERRKAPTKKMQIPTSVPVYTEPATFLRSFGCCMWSEVLSWHKTVSFYRWQYVYRLASILHDTSISAVGEYKTSHKKRNICDNMTHQFMSTDLFQKLYTPDIYKKR